ncbi:hypothetical protein [Endozoicomonas acroporae]|nr:hypothetical protein [Endozoicomonas acroporae]
MTIKTAIKMVSRKSDRRKKIVHAEAIETGKDDYIIRAHFTD